jgi:hypothetical protein
LAGEIPSALLKGNIAVIPVRVFARGKWLPATDSHQTGIHENYSTSDGNELEKADALMQLPYPLICSWLGF